MEAARGESRADRIKVAFHRASHEVQWHDISDPLGVIENAPGVVYDPETGRVTGMKEAVADLAKRKPHWVKGNQPTGAPRVEPGNGVVTAEKAAALVNKYPSLRGGSRAPASQPSGEPGDTGAELRRKYPALAENTGPKAKPRSDAEWERRKAEQKAKPAITDQAALWDKYPGLRPGSL
ncbi:MULTISPECIES: hypothetical protein [Pseudofrankia]|uniref:hypothetical protein n=1 Tax=Pseudofrankia TaxID=2994363 RepID=UPI001041F623|nr:MULTISPECIES: hypothetical protein [Pseudofrankia]